MNDAMTALQTALGALADHGRSVPCSGRDEWQSSDAETLRWAAEQCKTCPVKTMCRSAVGPHDSGTWGGFIFKEPTAKHPRRKKRNDA